MFSSGFSSNVQTSSRLSSYAKNCGTFLKHTAMITMAAVPTATATAVGYFADKDLKENSEVKGASLDASPLMSSLINASTVVTSGYWSLYTLTELWPQLTGKQRLLTCTLYTAGLVQGIYSLTQFNSKDNLFQTGGIAGGSQCAFFLAQYTASQLVKRKLEQYQQLESQALDEASLERMALEIARIQL